MNYVESALEQLQQAPGKATDTPKLVLGVHKGGSTMLHNFMRGYCRQAGIRHFSLSNYLYQAGVADAEWDRRHELMRLQSQNAVHFGFRQVPLYFLSNKSYFSQYPSIALIRDPRDCVTSAYFSFLKSHAAPEDSGRSALSTTASDNLKAERERYKDSSIDEYCVNEYPRFTQELARVAAFANCNTRIYRYEDIIFNKREFLLDALAWLGIEVSAKEFDNALERVDVVPTDEDPSRHIRSVTPGDHKQKLKQETQDSITEQSRNLLELFGYH
jgi:hypothetical protein